MDVKKTLLSLSNQQKSELVVGVDNWYTATFKSPNVPEIMMSDGPAGLRKQSRDTEYQSVNNSEKATSFPSAALVASTFNVDSAYSLGNQLGHAAHNANINMVLGPGVNIKRTPLGGRNFEYYSEDPLVAGKMGTAYVKGVQQNGVGATVKHFVANNRENQRMTNSSDIDMRTLREIYLKPFEMIVKNAKPAAIMASYNKLNGIQTVEHEWLLKNVLRDEWNFEGVVMSDWYAVGDSVASLNAGLDLEMPGNKSVSSQKILKALENGTISQETIDLAVTRILNMINDLQIADSSSSDTSIDNGHQVALDIARDGIVLLKNESALPISKNEATLIVGEFAKVPRYQGGGSSHVSASDPTSLLDSLNKMGYNTNYSQGFKVNTESIDTELEHQVLTQLEQYDKVILCLGFRDKDESEGFDKTNIELPINQQHLLNQIHKSTINTKIVVVLSNGSVIDTSWKNKVDSIVEGYLGGESGGRALADILTGKVNPSGKLAETFPEKISDTPMYETFNKDKKHEVYHEGLFVGYRYYDSREMKVSFPFGHGLSYTTFEYSNLKINQDSKIKITFEITNTGDFNGKEVPQLYVQNKASNNVTPVHELKEFTKIELQAHETKQITFVLDKENFQWFNPETNKWQADNGQYIIEIGSSSRDIRLTEEIIINILDNPILKISKETAIEDILNNKTAYESFKKHFSKLVNSVSNLNNTSNEMTAEQKTMWKMATNFPLKGMIAYGIPDNVIDNFIKETNQKLNKH